ncbi:hypothetical protein BDN72DRAFT_863518, partial [Pluteus cervinus]
MRFVIAYLPSFLSTGVVADGAGTTSYGTNDTLATTTTSKRWFFFPVSIRYATAQQRCQMLKIRVSYHHTTTTTHISWCSKTPSAAATTSEDGGLIIRFPRAFVLTTSLGMTATMDTQPPPPITPAQRHPGAQFRTRRVVFKVGAVTTHNHLLNTNVLASDVGFMFLPPTPRREGTTPTTNPQELKGTDLVFGSFIARRRLFTDPQLPVSSHDDDEPATTTQQCR